MPWNEGASKRRQGRLRREYLYRKSLEGRDRVSYEQKRLIREALAEGKSLPTELRASYDKLQAEISAEDTKTAEGVNSYDDEYADAGLLDPRVIVTTSRDPSSRLKQFTKEIKLLVPNSQRINRGNITIDELVSSCKQGGCSDIIVLQETRGVPDGLVISHLPHGPTAFFSLSGTVLRHDLDKVTPMSEAYPHIILNNFETKLGRRVGNILKCLFPVATSTSQRVLTFSNENDFISFRHHVYSKEKNASKIEHVNLAEVGPRFEMRLFQLRLGSLDQKDAENEFVLRPYQNTATKNSVL